MGIKSRQKKVRRALRPMMRAAVEKAREEQSRDIRFRKLVPDEVEVTAHPEPKTPLLLIPPSRAVEAVERSRQ